MASIVALGCCMGLAIGTSGAAHLHAAMDRCAEKPVKVENLQVLEDSKVGDFGTSCIAQTRLPDGSMAKLRVNLPEGMQVRCWQVLYVDCAIATPSDASRAYYWSKGCLGSVTPQTVSAHAPEGALGVVYDLRNTCIDRCQQAQDELGERCEDECALIEAILYGYREDLFASDLYQDVREVGLAHIVAVSGAHLVIISGFFAALLRSLRIRRHMRICLQCAFVLAYAAFAGMPISALRAAIMSMCSASAFFAGRRSSSASALSLCVIAMLCLHPFLAISLSLALSCCASLGIVLLARKLSAWMGEICGGHGSIFTQMLGVAVSANVLTMGVSAATFSQLPVIAPLSNIVATPLFTGLACVGMMGSMFAIAFPTHTTLAFLPAACLSHVFCQVVQILASIPHACIPADVNVLPSLVVGGIATYALYRFSGTVHSAVIIIVGGALALWVCASIAVFPRMHGTEVVMIDVGQGDAVLYRDGTHAILIDTGTEDAKILSGLARHDVSHLDAIVVSHPDDDHCGSLQAITRVVPTQRVCVAKDLLACGCQNCSKLRMQMEGLDVLPLEMGDCMQTGRLSFEVLAPNRFEDEGGNADSLVMCIRIDCDRDEVSDWSVLATGDAEANTLAKIADRGNLDPVDILKVPHHGSSGGVDNRLMQVIDPQLCLISVGAGNRYGHPSDDTLETIRCYGCKVLRTDVDGDVVCRLTVDAMRVNTVR